MAGRQRTRPQIYELYVELEAVTPTVWRRFLVPATITLPKLHNLLQLAMGWTNSHLHGFLVGDAMYGMDEFGDLDMRDERRQRLQALLGDEIREFVYAYDFGDDWRCRVKVTPVTDPNPDWHYPLCIGGERAAPPEDVGGPMGYESFLEAIEDPDHDAHQEMLVWIGGAFDPNGFDLNAINLKLRLGRW